jgi:hypothetical protein
MVTPARDSEKCEACGHPWENDHRLEADGLTHNVTSDGKLWCVDCDAECALIAQLRAERDEAVRLLKEPINAKKMWLPVLESNLRKKWEEEYPRRVQAFLARLRPEPNGGGPE